MHEHTQPVTDIRSYEPDDYAECRALWVELAEHHRRIYQAPWIGGDDPGSGLDEFLAHQHWIGAWVAATPGTVIGLAGLLADGGGAELEPIIVSNEARGRGVGTDLIDRVFSEARGRGIDRVSVKVVARNVDGMAFYHTVGFRTVGEIELMAMVGETRATWQPGLTIHGVAFDY